MMREENEAIYGKAFIVVENSLLWYENKERKNFS